jgi:flagellar export protein FliJ
MAAPFEVLLKVARTRRDAAAQALNLAQQRLAQVRAQIMRLEAIERGTHSTDETMFATGAFLCQLGRSKRQLLDEIPGIERRVDAAKQETLEAFGECKRLEVLLDRQARAAAQEEARRETQYADELAQIQYQQRGVRP